MKTIYFFSDRRGHVKIGISTNPSQRLASLQTCSPTRLTPLLCLQGTDDDERFLHERFGDYRVMGEWFKENADILNFIEHANSDALELAVRELYEDWIWFCQETWGFGAFLFEEHGWSDAVQDRPHA